MLDVERCGEIADIECPREIGKLNPSVADRAGAAEAGGDDAVIGSGIVRVAAGVFVEKLEDNLIEGGMLGSGVLLVANRLEFAGFEVVEGEMNFGAADVTCEDHEG